MGMRLRQSFGEHNMCCNVLIDTFASKQLIRRRRSLPFMCIQNGARMHRMHPLSIWMRVDLYLMTNGRRARSICKERMKTLKSRQGKRARMVFWDFYSIELAQCREMKKL